MANPFISRERIDSEVCQAIATTLRKEAGDIDMDASIKSALGATSLDFLDINFRLENTFGVRLASQMLVDHVEEEFGEGIAVDRDDKLTESAATLMRMYLGENDGLKAGMYRDEIPDLVTPKIIAESVDAIVGELPDACPACGASAWGSEDGAKVSCSACSKDAAYPDGDELTKRWIHKIQNDSKIFALDA